MAQTYDMVIAGAGPAGCGAALGGVARGLQVALVATPTPEGEFLGGWVSPAGVALCKQIGVRAATAFAGLNLHAWDLSQAVTVDDPALAGWIVEPRQMETALLAAAERGGAAVLRDARIGALQLGDDAVNLTLGDGATVTGRVLVVADGLLGRAAAQARLPLAHRAATGTAARAAWGGAATARGARARLDVVLGGGRGLCVATFAQDGHGVRAALGSRNPDAPAGPQLAELIRAGQAAGWLPPGAAEIVEAPLLAGSALELDSHAGKRCLLAGEAGGFVAALSMEAIYPALRSGEIAAEVAETALKARLFQDELATYNAAWRAALAEYLSLPNTDLGLLLPMIFKNAQMAKRVAHAFLLGKAF